MRGIEIRLEKPKICFFGIGLMACGVLIPGALNIYNMGVFRTSMLALAEDQKLRIVEAALRLWLLNTLRALPHYLGAFLIADAVSVKMPGNLGPVVKCVMMGIMILAVYRGIELLHHIQYDIGVPAISMIIILILLVRIDFNMVPAIKKAVVILFLVGSFQCLDIMPILEGYGFGRGESSRMIKNIAAFMGAEQALNITLLFLMCLMLLNFLLYSMLVADENHLRLANLEKELKQKEMVEMRVKMVQSRTYMELEQLVHDLKTPLTSILTLAGITRMTEDKEKQRIYLNSIETSVENLNEQISEILDEQRFTRLTVEEFMNGLSAQVSHMPYGDMVQLRVENPESLIEVNRIRAFRMLINLIENASYAVKRENGVIVCRAESRVKNGMPMVEFTVEDNGIGMTDDTIASAFEQGFSTKGSSGLGLSFVKNVVECHEGMIEVESVLNEGTKIHIWIPEGNADEE